MPKEQFRLTETQRPFKLLEETSRRSGVSRAQAFEESLHMWVCAFSGGQMEDQYMELVKKYSEGGKGRRGCDSIAEMLAEIIMIMEETREDVLGDLFQGAITYGEAGQFLTPPNIAKVLAKLSMSDLEEKIDGTRPSVYDSCCGSGTLLLAAADEDPHCEFVGQDIDLRCVRMTALNLALRNLYGWVMWGNTLTLETILVYRTGFNGIGVIREVPPEECPYVVLPSSKQDVRTENGLRSEITIDDRDRRKDRQKELF